MLTTLWNNAWVLAVIAMPTGAVLLMVAACADSFSRNMPAYRKVKK